LDERVLTLAGEGVELPIATEHNLQVDYHAAAVRQGVRRHFTPVVGNEVTTAIGHFNVFPAPAGGEVPDHQSKDWVALFGSIRERTAAPVVILNHGRDVHAGFRPFGPEHHHAATGENLDGWTLRANAMEVMNSGSQQTDLWRLYRDWFALLNHGTVLTPVGSSDSHDVNRYIVGQGRTYVRVKDDEPGAIDAAAAAASFLEGRVLVSCGLLVEITVNGRYGPGDLATASGGVEAAVRVLGPGWVKAEKVELFSNGIQIREAAIADGERAGLKWAGSWTLPRAAYDVHLAAVATGPGVRGPFWPIARPYQPRSPDVERKVVGSTGAVWIDGDGDGKRSSARDHARRLFDETGPDAPKLARALGGFDEAVAAQAAGLLEKAGAAVDGGDVLAAAREAGPQVERGFKASIEASMESRAARGP
jgi:hypothetical protein